MRIADLRTVGPAVVRGIARVEAGEQGQIVRRHERDAHAGCRHRIGRAAVGIVDAGDRGPAPCGVEERAAALADEELGVGRQLSEANREAIGKQLLIEPQLEQAHVRKRLDEAHRHQHAQRFGGDALAVNPVAVGEEAQPRPADHLVEVGLQCGLEATHVEHPLLKAAGRIAEPVADVVDLETDAVPVKPRADAGGVRQLARQAARDRRDRARRGCGRLPRRSSARATASAPRRRSSPRATAAGLRAAGG